MGGGNHSAQHRLPLLKILWGAFALPWQRRRELLSTAAMPLLAVTASWFEQTVWSGRGFDLILLLLNVIAFCWLALSIHRLVLLGETYARVNPFADSSLRRFGIFFAAAIGLWLFYFALRTVLNMVAMPLAESYLGDFGERDVHPILLSTTILALWPVARLAPMLPAIAVDGPVSPIAVCKVSRGNDVQLVVIAGVLPNLLLGGVSLLFGGEMSLLQVAAAAVLLAVCVIIQVFAISLAYQQLTAPAPPPTAPPA